MMANVFSINSARPGAARQNKGSNNMNQVWGADKDKIKQYYLDNAAATPAEEQAMSSRSVTKISSDSWWQIA